MHEILVGREATAHSACCCGQPLLPRLRKAPGNCSELTKSVRRRNARRRTDTRTMAYGMMAPALAPVGASATLSGLLSSFSLALGAFGLAYFLSLDQQDHQGRPECSTCEGSGRVPCICQKWSDGDKGCAVCQGSGRMACPSCHGGGTAVPIAVKVTVRDEPYQRMHNQILRMARKLSLSLSLVKPVRVATA